jgi:hypothetical protein
MPLPGAAAPAMQLELVTYGYVPWSMSSSAPCAPFEQERIAARARGLDEARDVRDHRRDLRSERERLVAHLRERQRRTLVVVLEHEVVQVEQLLELGREAVRVEQVLHRAARGARSCPRRRGPMPRPVVPTLFSPSANSRAWSSATWIGSTSGQAQARCAARAQLDARRLELADLLRQRRPGDHDHAVADVDRYAFAQHARRDEAAGSSCGPPITSVCPALWPPWKRTTPCALSVSQSTILPLPSSPTARR